MTPQTTSLELSKRLQKLGVPQESYFGWSVPTSEDAIEVTPMPGVYRSDMQWGEDYEKIAAYTTDELGRMIFENDDLDETVPWHANGDWYFYKGEELSDPQKNESEARGSMLEYLLVNGLVKASELKI